MSIKINITDEMIEAHRDAWHDNPRPLPSEEAAIRAVLAIVERDLNASADRDPFDDRAAIIESCGSVEVSW